MVAQIVAPLPGQGASATTVFFARDPSTVPTGGEFDDLVTWISPNILYNRMISAGRLP